jgi:hypothetical protein
MKQTLLLQKEACCRQGKRNCSVMIDHTKGLGSGNFIFPTPDVGHLTYIYSLIYLCLCVCVCILCKIQHILHFRIKMIVNDKVIRRPNGSKEKRLSSQ